MAQWYQDAMALVRHYGKPDLFITMTCNPYWPEIEKAPPSEKAIVSARVFYCKLEKLKNDLFKHHVLGRVVAYVYVIEFQKRGLPHAHMLLILADDNKPRCPDDYDAIVTAEITTLDTPKHRALRELQLKHMVHGCRAKCFSEDAPDHENCMNRYPRLFRNESEDTEESYPQYRRRSPEDGGHESVGRGGRPINNSMVVPHNVWLLKKYNCHINVEICTSISSVKYLYKYVYKGHDRYVTSSEVTWRALEFPMNQMYPRVDRLAKF
jgi:hypothetical protein